MSNTKISRRSKIHLRIRKKVSGTPERPRLAVYRSNLHIYAQLIDDLSGKTIMSVSSKDESIINTNVNKVEKSKLVGSLLAKKAIEKGQLNVESNSDARFMNAKITDSKVVPILYGKYKTDLFVFINHIHY